MNFFCFHQRAPLYTPEVYRKWIEAIEVHQRFDRSKVYFNVCVKHFEPTDLEVRGGKTCLKKDAVPTIFGVTGKTIESQDSDPDFNHSPECSECTECTCLKRDLIELKTKMLKLKVDDDVGCRNYQNRSKLCKIYVKSKKLLSTN